MRSTNSYDFSKVEAFLLKLFQEFNVFRVNELPIQARQSIITMVDLEQKRQDQKNQLDLRVMQITQHDRGCTVTFIGGIIAEFPPAYVDHLHHSLMSGDPADTDLVWPYIQPYVEMMAQKKSSDNIGRMWIAGPMTTNDSSSDYVKYYE
jgi:hypothetical protein